MNAKWSFGWIFDQMCACTTDEQAKAFFDKYVEWMRANATGLAATMDPAEAVRNNIGYLGGYGMSDETIKRFQRITGSVHPFFGPKEHWSEGKDPVERGRALGEAAKAQRRK